MMEFYIYVLIDPRNYQVRYVGKAADPLKRLAEHLRSQKNAPRDQWVDQLKQLGLQPILEIVGTCNESTWPKEEDRWMRKYKRHDLLNARTTYFNRTSKQQRVRMQKLMECATYLRVIGEWCKVIGLLDADNCVCVFGGPHTLNGYYYFSYQNYDRIYIPKSNSLYSTNIETLPIMKNYWLRIGMH